jgi:hypothetical protein
MTSPLGQRIPRGRRILQHPDPGLTTVADSRLREGYLLLADISGYTAFLTGNELEHAQGIIEDLTRAILAGCAPPARVVKLEGDAVFAYVPGAAFAQGERILDFCEAVYARFVDRREAIKRATTCSCRACQEMDTLDLKVVVHFGSFVVQDLAGVEDLAGPDVILVHRLLKNSVIERTGIAAYVLLTDPVLARAAQPLALARHQESYESFGDVGCGVADLRAAYDRTVALRRVYVGRAEADFSLDVHVPVPPAVAWEYFTNPVRSLRFLGGTTGWQSFPDDRGRTGAGSSAHCAHGKGLSLTSYVDWRPFQYFSSEKAVIRNSMMTPPPMVETVEFTPEGEGECMVSYRFRVKDRGPAMRLRLKLMKPLVRRMFSRVEADFRRVLEEEEAAAAAREAGLALPEPARAG